MDAYSTVAGTAVPFVVGTAGLSTTSPLYPQGATFGLTGAVTYSFIGPILAGLAGNSITAPAVTVGGFALAPDPDGTVTGSFPIPTFGPTTLNITAAATVTGATWSITPVASVTGVRGTHTNVCVIVAAAGAFVPGDIGDGIVSSPNDFQGNAIADVTATGNNAILNVCPTVASTAASTISLYGIQTLTQTISTGSVFTTNAGAAWTANHATTADIELASAGTNTIGFTLGPLTAGPGATGTNSATNGAVITGFTGAAAAGPGISATTPFVATCSAAPGLPNGSVTALQSTGCPTTATDNPADVISVPLADAAPTPQNQNAALGVGQTATVQLVCTPSNPAGTITSFSTPTTSPQTTTTGNALSFTLTAATGALALNDTGQSGAGTVDILFNCTDNLGVASTTTGDVHVSLGTPPVVQPFEENVVGASLVLSCNSPANYVAGAAALNQSPAPASENPLLQCPEFNFPSITLDGLEQTVQATTGETNGLPSGTNPGTIYVSDNRGSPTDQWTLSATMIATPNGTAASGGNPNASCAGVVAFCDSSVGTSALNTATNGAHDGQIGPSYLQVNAITCVADSLGGTGAPGVAGTPYNAPNLNPNATPNAAGGNFASTVSLCSAAMGQSGGTFIYNATYFLTMPESIYDGLYIGSIRYTVG